MKWKWTTSDKHAGLRLDVFVTEKLPDMTRSQVQKWLKRGLGTVDGAPASVHQFLKSGEKVTFTDELEPEKRRLSPNARKATPDLHIIAETPDYLIIDKPTGLLVHPDSKQKDGTLVEALIAHDPKIAKLGVDPERAGIVHRLDRDVSGLMVIPRTQNAFDSLKQQFAEHSVDKRYIALVYGEVTQDEGDLKFRIARSTSKNRMAARPEHEVTGRAAWTHYTTLKRYHNATLLELTILSGRTHQIRAHMLAFNHPVIGDPLYKRNSEDRRMTAPRIMLQSVHMSFKDPSTGETRTYDIKPDPAFAEVTKTLKVKEVEPKKPVTETESQTETAA